MLTLEYFAQIWGLIDALIQITCAAVSGQYHKARLLFLSILLIHDLAVTRREFGLGIMLDPALVD